MATANHVLLRRITLTANAASITFDSIPQTGYTDLKIVVSSRDTSSDGFAFAPTFNGITTSYNSRWIEGDGTYGITYGTTNQLSGYNTRSNQTASTFAVTNIYIPNAFGSNYKSFTVETAQENNATLAFMALGAGLWSNTAAISSIQLSSSSGNFVTGTSFSLYGIANATTIPLTAPKADGGDIIKTDGTYWYHAFLSSGIFKPQVNLTCDYLVVAGGGAGNTESGGGGAGGLRYATSQALTTSNYTVTVGAGGVGVYRASTAGSDSSLNGTTSAGGGAGSIGINGNSGGSGSGGGQSGAATTGGAGNTPSTSPSQGNNGGANVTTYPYPGGGGGGAGAVGQTAPSRTLGGAGGAGVNTYSSWASATGTGASGYYAGGGGGGVFYNADSPTAGAGGSGGGGAGSLASATATSGTANTGGGGGAAGSGGTGGSGGSGIVIIRYAV